MLSSEIKKKIKQIEIHTRRLLRGSLVGDNRSAIKGSGLDFDQIREYQMGDDVRFIDWNSSARMDKLLVKQYIEERSRTVILVVDVSASGLFASSECFKQEKMAQIASVLALVADSGNDHVSLLLFSDEVELFVPPAKGRHHVYAIMEHLFSHKQHHKTTRVASALEYLARLSRKDAVVFLISDFLDEGFEKSLAITAKKYDLIAIRCLDPNECALPSVGFITVEDSETGECITLDTRRSRRNGLPAFLANRITKQDTLFKKYGIDYLDIKNNRPFIGEIVRFFRRRMRY